MTLPTRVGRYEVVRHLSQGRLSAVYLARDPTLGRTIALKLLFVGDAEIRERFIREARTAANLRHSNIVTVFDVSEDRGQPFIAMEYVEGETLAELIRRKESLSVATKLEMMAGVCEGLAYAHRQGMVHLDVTPANLILEGSSGSVKILGFGNARDWNTEARMLIGTVGYVAPERLQGGQPDHRSDIFSVGAVLYELLTYRQAFQAPGVAGLFHKVLHENPAPVAFLDPKLTQILDRALAKRPDDRYQDARPLAQDLRRVIQNLRGDDPDVTMARPAPSPRPSEPSGPGRAQIQKLRAKQIEAYLVTAEASLAARDLDSAFEAVEWALLLDPVHSGATEIYKRVEQALRERKVAAVLEEARATILAGHFNEALAKASESLSAMPNELASLREAVHRAIEGRHANEERARNDEEARRREREEQPGDALPDPVLLGASAPREVAPGNGFSARFVAYVEARESVVMARLTTLAGPVASTTIVGLAPLRGGRWRRGAPVTVCTSGDHFSVEQPKQSFEWNGREQLLSFAISVPENASPRTTVLCFDVFLEDVPVARVSLDVRISDRVTDATTAQVVARAPETAFASYASQDRALVALCLSALHRHDPGLDVFMDCLDVKPNVEWQKELERVIPLKDVFFLFWSANAMNSPWVKWELQTVKTTRGLGVVCPMPLDDPASAPPPEELAHLNFRDRYLTARDGALLANRPDADSS